MNNMKLKKYNSFLTESNDDYETHSDDNEMMKDNNDILVEIYDNVTGGISKIQEMYFDYDDNNMTEDVETLEEIKNEIEENLGIIEGLLEQSSGIFKKYLDENHDENHDEVIDNVLKNIGSDSQNTGKPDKSGKYVGEDLNYYFYNKEDDMWTYDSIAHDGPQKWIPVF